jgi:predicted dienelactone hydrolase
MAKSDPAYRAATEEVRSCRDPRVRAVFAMAPGLADAFLPDSLALIDIPVAIVAGAADEVVSVKRNAEFFAAKIPRAQLTIFPAPPVHCTRVREVRIQFPPAVSLRTIGS